MRSTEITCNTCEERITVNRSGGRNPTIVFDVYVVPATRFTVTNNKGEVFDYCSRDCLEAGDFE